MHKSGYFLIVLLSLISTFVLSQESSVVDIKNADELKMKRTDDGFVRELRGNVEIQIDSTHFFSNFLNLFPNDDIYARGDIVIKQGDSLHIYSDTLDYTALNEMAFLYGEVVFDDRGRKLFTTELHYDVRHKIAHYDTFGLLTDDEAQFTSYFGRYNVNTDMAFFRDSVELIHPDVIMRTDSMRYDANRQIAYFLGPTILRQKDALIYCEGGFYDLANQRSFLKHRVQYKEDDKIITADSMRYDGKLNEVTLLGDKPQYKTETVQASANKMVYNDSTKIASLFHNAEVHTSKEDIRGDTIYYNTDTERYRTSGGIHVVSGDRIIEARNTYFDDSTNANILYNEVYVRDTSEGFAILGKQIEYRDSLGYIRSSEGRPLLYFLSDDKADTTFISADSIISYEIFRDSLQLDTGRIMKAFYNVKVLSRDYQAICDSLTYNSLDSIIHFHYNPVLWADTTQLKGDTITATLDGDGMKSIFVRENTLIVQHEKAELFNQISGRTLKGHFVKGDMKYADLVGNVHSVYYIKDDEQAFSGVAEFTAASLRMYYDNGQMQGFTYYSQPNGTMHPMTVNHFNLRLPGFIWLEEKRPLNLEDLKAIYTGDLKFVVEERIQ